MNDGAALSITERFEVIYCFKCRMPFAVPGRVRAGWVGSGESFYCPNGHVQHYTEAESTRLKRELEAAQKNSAWYKQRLLDERAANERTVRRLNAQRANVTKLKRRIAAGVCPCCTRTFTNLSRHMASQHPGYHHQESA